MTSFLIRLLLLLIILWLVRRLFLQLFAKLGERIEPSAEDHPGRMVKDPVCGMYLDPRLAVSLGTKEGTFYFCSEECSSKFPLKKAAR